MGLFGAKKVSQEDIQALMQQMEASKKAAEKAVEFEVIIAASGTKGGYLREAHPELSDGVLYCSIVKWRGGQCYTTDSTGEIVLWEAEEMIDASCALRIPQEALGKLEVEFNRRNPGITGGRAAQIRVTATEEFSMNSSGVYFCEVLSLGELLAPEGSTPTAAEQKRLAAERKAQTKALREERTQRSRSMRMGKQQELVSKSEEQVINNDVEEISDDADLANISA
jgi:hypothetical protein